VPLPLHYGLVETVARKLTYAWPALLPERLSYYAGNFGDEGGTALPRDLPQSALLWAQWIMAAAGIIAVAFARSGRGAEPVPDSPRRGLRIILTVLLVVLLGGALVIERYPALDRLPTRVVVTAFAGGIPSVNTEGVAAHQAALLQRGRYLYGIASCPYCHNADGAGGGKVNWSAFGTMWVPNLTTHQSGLATWSDAAVLRAMVSGVRRDGRALHWQAMIWDHVSNYSLEDQHALLAYLRSLPAVDRTTPPPVSPGPTDCPGDTFWIGATNQKPGCAD
jgi:hypothetical protein